MYLYAHDVWLKRLESHMQWKTFTFNVRWTVEPQKTVVAVDKICHRIYKQTNKINIGRVCTLKAMFF